MQTLFDSEHLARVLRLARPQRKQAIRAAEERVVFFTVQVPWPALAASWAVTAERLRGSG